MTHESNSQARALVAGISDIPSLPDIYLRIRSILQDPASSHSDLADALATDPGMAARLLKMANSAFYGRPGTIDTIGRAVSLLGTQQVHDLVLATTLINTFQGVPTEPLDAREFWYASVLSGATAKLLAEHVGILDCERLFVAGLVAQIGQLPLCQRRPSVMRELLNEAAATGLPIDRLERREFGFDYADVSAELFADWQFPEELLTPIRLHNRPAEAGDFVLEASILHIAIRSAIPNGGRLDTVLPLINDDAWQATELTLSDLEAIHTEAVSLAEGIAPVLLSAAA